MDWNKNGAVVRGTNLGNAVSRAVTPCSTTDNFQRVKPRKSIEKPADVYANITNEFQNLLNWKSSLEVTLSQKNERIEQLQQAIESQRQACINFQFEIDKLKADKAEAIKIQEEFTVKYTLLRQLTMRLKDHFGDLKSQIDCGQKSTRFIDENLIEYSQKFQNLNDRLESMKQAYSQKLEVSENAVEVERQSAAEVQRSYEEKFCEYQEKIDMLNAKLETQNVVTNEIKKSAQKQNEELNAVITEKNDILSQLSDLQAEKMECLNYLDDQKTTIALLNDEKEQMVAKFDAMTMECETVTANYYKESQNVQELKEELSSKELNLREYEKMLNEKELEHAKFCNEASDLREELTSRMTELDNQNQNLNEEVSSNQQKIDAQYSLLQEKDKAIFNLEEQCNEKEQVLADKIRELENYTNHLKVKEKEFSSVNEAWSDKESLLMAEVENFRNELEEKALEQEANVGKCIVYEQQMSTLEQELKFMQIRIDDLEYVVKMKENLISKMERDNEKKELEQQSALNDLLVTKDAEILKLEARISRMNDRIFTADNASLSTKSDMKVLQQEIIVKEETITAQREKISSLKENLEETKVINFDLDEKLLLVKEELNAVKGSLVDQTEERNCKQKELKKVQSELDEGLKTNKKLERSIDKMKKQIQDEVTKRENKENEENLELQKMHDKVTQLEESGEKKTNEIYRLTDELSNTKKDHPSGSQKKTMEDLKAQRDLYFLKWAELQKINEREVMAKRKEINSLQAELNQLKNEIKNKQIFGYEYPWEKRFAEQDQAKGKEQRNETMKPDLKNKENKGTLNVKMSPTNHNDFNKPAVRPFPIPAIRPIPFNQRKFATPATPSKRKKTNALPSTRFYDDIMNTSDSSDCMDVEIDENKNLKLHPAKKTKRRSSQKNTPLISNTPKVDSTPQRPMTPKVSSALQRPMTPRVSSTPWGSMTPKVSSIPRGSMTPKLDSTLQRPMTPKVTSTPWGSMMPKTDSPQRVPMTPKVNSTPMSAVKHPYANIFPRRKAIIPLLSTRPSIAQDYYQPCPVKHRKFFKLPVPEKATAPSTPIPKKNDPFEMKFSD